MINKLKKYTKEIILFSILLFVMSNAISLYRSTDLNKVELLLSDVTLIEGKSYTINNKKPIMIHFWATWCPICKVEASNIQQISEDFQVLSIATQSGSDEEIKNYQKENGVNFMVINDQDGSLTKSYGVTVFPTTIIYDTNQNVAFSDVGYTSTWVLWIKMFWSSL
ncbi:MAG TPA: redoxin domain-containing protein [Sulfurospirillum arcachonense]|nr:redoxin domain-containing protein [Sulfurospirillum arcachonense]